MSAFPVHLWLGDVVSTDYGDMADNFVGSLKRSTNKLTREGFWQRVVVAVVAIAALWPVDKNLNTIVSSCHNQLVNPPYGQFA